MGTDTKVLMKLRINNFNYLWECTQLSLHPNWTCTASEVLSLLSKHNQELGYTLEDTYHKYQSHNKSFRAKYLSQCSKKTTGNIEGNTLSMTYIQFTYPEKEDS